MISKLIGFLIGITLGVGAYLAVTAAIAAVAYGILWCFGVAVIPFIPLWGIVTVIRLVFA